MLGQIADIMPTQAYKVIHFTSNTATLFENATILLIVKKN